MSVPTWMSQMFDVIAELGRYYLESPVKKHSLEAVTKMCETLLVRKGEASGTALDKEIVNSYNNMRGEEQVLFLSVLNTQLAPDARQIVKAAQAYVEKQDDSRFEC